MKIERIIENIIATRVVTVFNYPSIRKREVNVFYLLPNETVEISDEKKVILSIERKGLLKPYIIAYFPKLIPSKSKLQNKQAINI